MLKKGICLTAVILTASCLLGGCGGSEPTEYLTVINYGEYIEMDILDQFEEETGIEIKYEEALTPEDLYAKYSSGAISYDILCTSDYMIKRLIQEGEAQKVDFSAMEYIDNIGDRFWELTDDFDPNNEYALPYFYGTVGILYDTTKVDGEIDSWGVLFDGSFKNDIIMQNSQRDTFMVALKYLGYSLNTSDEGELQEALDLLIKQKPDVQAYLVDEARDEVVAGNAAMAVIYSGEAYLGHEYNEDLAYVVPKEGSNKWVDTWIVTKNCQNMDAAQKFLDFLCREDIAMQNFEYAYYPTPNEAVIANMGEELRNNPIISPDEAELQICEVYTQIDEEVIKLYNDLWKELKAD